MIDSRIYLDHNATTPVDPRVLQDMLPYFTQAFGNAASIDHDFGYEAKQAVENARDKIAKLINAKPDEIIFTSGATESDNIALFGIADRYKEQGNHIITCATEHKAILDTCKRLERDGFKITYLPVDSVGKVHLSSLAESITKETILISIMAANNEIGTIAPLAEIGKIAKAAGILFHTDAAQAFGHIPLDVQKMNIDMMSISGHKIYGPKGVGVLYRRKSNPRVNLSPIIYGGGHERGIRSGTLNVPGIVGIGKAAEIAYKEMQKDAMRFKEWTNFIFQQISSQIDDVYLNGHPDERLPNNLNISIAGIESKALIVLLKNIAISTGSACTTTSVEPSHVIEALGYGEARSHSAIRIGVGKFNNLDQVKIATNTIIAALQQLHSIV